MDAGGFERIGGWRGARAIDFPHAAASATALAHQRVQAGKPLKVRQSLGRYLRQR